MKESIRAVIICAGEATRWRDFMGVPKHLIRIEGEVILHRTVRLLKEQGVDDIVIVSKDDNRYNIEGTTQYIITPNYEENADADKFLSSKGVWNTSGKTLMIYGDCYFTDKAIFRIVNACRRRADWMLFCRPTESKVTGSKWGECFCMFIPSGHINLFEDKLHHIAELHKAGLIKRCGGWELYRAMTGREDSDLGKHYMTTNWYLIDDWTEDFDFPKDYQMWIKRRISKFGPQIVVTNPMINGKRMYNEG